MRPLAWGYAVLMIPNEDETAVHGCHCACGRYWPYRRVGTCASVLKLVLLATHLPFTPSPPTCPSPPRHSTALHPRATRLPFTLFLPTCPSPSSYPTALHSLATHLPFAPSPLNCPSSLCIPAALHSLHPCTLHTLLKMQIVKTHTLF